MVCNAAVEITSGREHKKKSLYDKCVRAKEKLVIRLSRIPNYHEVGIPYTIAKMDRLIKGRNSTDLMRVRYIIKVSNYILDHPEDKEFIALARIRAERLNQSTSLNKKQIGGIFLGLLGIILIGISFVIAPPSVASYCCLFGNISSLLAVGLSIKGSRDKDAENRRNLPIPVM